MKTSEKLKQVMQAFRPHINGHRTAIELFYVALDEVLTMEKTIANQSVSVSIRERFNDIANGGDVDGEEISIKDLTQQTQTNFSINTKK